MHTLRCISTNVCGRLGKLKQVGWCTLNTFEISFKNVVNTLLHVGKKVSFRIQMIKAVLVYVK